MQPLKVDPDVAFHISRSVSNEAVELHDQLVGLQRDWDNLARGWSGTASSAYAPLWEEWLEGATTLVDTLEELAHKVAVTASEYVDQDGQSASSVASVPIERQL
ncbi:WXG100 family type VII secretion target [Mycolicibacterium iranicum]|uniref:ESAT-6-like protein n=1 Tax=Mycolicibacterium iranicum TaxID=912594 RepID=A0A178LHK9_MYCIR|nr:WXG100 family type VII secretion target [Mycolicibacterium iranicum]OAN30213.1 Fis family transcriptional regulator [Mycolicibacterium iranicum]